MSSHPRSTQSRVALAAGGVVLVPVLCCGLPLLIAAGAAGTLAAVLANTWTISAASAVLVVAVVWRLATRRRGRHECGPHLQRRHTNE